MEKKNLIFVFADQWRRDAMGFAGVDPVKTPNMDAFASESVYCTNAVSTFPLCSPHRASLLTGKHPLSVGFFTNCKTGLSMGLKESEICIGDVLKQEGYDTAYIGKWHLDEPEKNYEEVPVSGARNWDAYTPPGAKRHGFDFWYSYGAWDEHMHPHYWQDTSKMKEVEQWSPEHETDVALNWLKNRNNRNERSDKNDRNDKNEEKPFAMFLSWNPPHSPYDQVPQKYLDLYPEGSITLKENVDVTNVGYHTYETADYDQHKMEEVTRQYFAAVSGLDEQFGRLIEYVKSQGLYEDTWIVLSADHGDMMGSHGLMAKHVWYEESIGIPLVVGGAVKRSGRCHTVIGSPDFMPTLLGHLQISIPESVEGVDCSEVIRDGIEQDDKLCYLLACPGREVFLEEFKKAGKNPKDFGWRGIRTQRYTYIVEVGYQVEINKKRYLYDLKEDALQMHPLLVEDPRENPITEQLEQVLLAWLSEQKDGFLQWMQE